ncbi:hypothetical protein Q0Z83_056030 [Actinoplanes sichuanensis]|uniref:Uncharacterized protein n=1 Tax=Actinoplanes sichuanensis TaxID=512349 RepID=A0ABW4AQM6_9ACTN|nr:hypothetical protein [Actinoplanes sichuanensis]BEL07412.1 hypothetical protein Q0Z83_056030 [Actinoplanes sichuanensis]
MTSTAVVSYDCDHCAGGATFGETIFGGRLYWSMSHACHTANIEACGRDESPDEWRAALLEQGGAYRLRIGDGNRVAAMRVLRERRGTPMAEIAALLETLRGPGLIGTEMELRLLAGRLAEAGVTASVLPGAGQAGDITS